MFRTQRNGKNINTCHTRNCKQTVENCAHKVLELISRFIPASSGI